MGYLYTHRDAKGVKKIKKILYKQICWINATPGLSGFWDQSQENSALYIAFWSVEPTDFKNVIVENIHLALSL